MNEVRTSIQNVEGKSINVKENVSYRDEKFNKKILTLKIW